MQVRSIKIGVVIVVIIVTLALLFGIKFANERLNIEKPLFELYSETKLVQKPSIDMEGKRTTISLTLKKTDNLLKAYQKIKGETEKVLGDTAFELKVEDKRSPAMENAYRNSQFVVYEALENGNYTRIPAEVEKEARKIGAESRVYIDEDNIYVSMYKGDNYLYEIVPRKNYQLTGAVADTMGSEQSD